MASADAQPAQTVPNEDLKHVLRKPFGYTAPARTVAELKIIKLGGAIRDKPHWNRKIQEAHINAEWRHTFEQQSTDPAMTQYIMAEQQHLAGVYTGDIYPAAVPGVFAADDYIPPELRAALMEAVQKLEEEGPPDWHPGSEDQVRDLVHPSLYPAVYGVTRQLPDSTPDLTLTTCIKAITAGSPITGPPPHANEDSGDTSKRFHWLPSEFDVDQEGKVSIQSYINNLHPHTHAAMYPVLASMFQHFVPLFNEVLTAYGRGDQIVIDPGYDWYSHNPEPPREDFEDEDLWYEAMEDWEENKVARQPDIPDFSPPEAAEKLVDLKGRRVQVITKLASIHLTPEKPEYPGGSWHLEGMENESILATGVYYYDQHNVEPSRIAFRAAVSDEDLHYEQNDFNGVETVYGLENEVDGNQELGAVTTLAQRCLCFTNNLQHQVSGFKLADASQPGHRKILVFWLVHPCTRVPSTSRVPPQQLDWLMKEVYQYPTFWPSLLPRDPQMLIEGMLGEVSDCPFGVSKAKGYRGELMDERKYYVGVQNEELFERAIFLCEH